MFHSPDSSFFLMPPSDPVPKLGQTRCYWALLSADLDYLYIDPVLRSHLGPQADHIIGNKLLHFVHPDEHASAQQDLGKVLDSRTLHGSVTRVRYSRLGRLRARLGYTGVHQSFADEDKVSFDENYIACDLVINWAAEGLVLCFIHAVVDMSPQDNDEHRRTHWTNWCGTPRMNDQHGTELYHALFHVAPQGPQGAPPPTRVFQILHNSTDRPTLFSWPPDGYIPADYGRLANDVQIGGANGSDAKTSCTRRYKAQQLLNSADGSVRDVESIFIPHGHIIFACHKATPRRPRGHPNSYPLYPTPAQFYDHTASTSYYPPSVVPSQPQIDPYSAPPSYPPSYPSSSSTTTTNTATSTPSPAPPQARISYPAWTPSPSSDSPHPHRPSPTPSHPRTSGNPPAGISRCAACKSTSSPEWRKGPSGRKELCNACGLRYSRARAKKEGVVVQRRRKDAGGGGVSEGKGRRAPGTYVDSFQAQSAQDAGNEYPVPPAGEMYQYPPHQQQQQQQHQGPSIFMGPGGASSSSSSASASSSAASYPPQQHHNHNHNHHPHPHQNGYPPTPTTTTPSTTTATSSYERSHVS